MPNTLHYWMDNFVTSLTGFLVNKLLPWLVINTFECTYWRKTGAPVTNVLNLRFAVNCCSRGGYDAKWGFTQGRLNDRKKNFLMQLTFSVCWLLAMHSFFIGKRKNKSWNVFPSRIQIGIRAYICVLIANNCSGVIEAMYLSCFYVSIYCIYRCLVYITHALLSLLWD